MVDFMVDFCENDERNPSWQGEWKKNRQTYERLGDSFFCRLQNSLNRVFPSGTLYLQRFHARPDFYRVLIHDATLRFPPCCIP